MKWMAKENQAPAFEPIALELPLPPPEYYYEQQQKQKQRETENIVERGVWTIEI